MCSCAGDTQHAPPLLLQSLHGAAQLPNALCLCAELLVQPFYPDTDRFLGLALVPGRAGVALCGESLHQFVT